LIFNGKSTFAKETDYFLIRRFVIPSALLSEVFTLIGVFLLNTLHNHAKFHADRCRRRREITSVWAKCISTNAEGAVKIFNDTKRRGLSVTAELLVCVKQWERRHVTWTVSYFARLGIDARAVAWSTAVAWSRVVTASSSTSSSVMPKFHYTNFTETSPKLPRDKSPRLVYDLSPTCLGEVSGKWAHGLVSGKFRGIERTRHVEFVGVSRGSLRQVHDKSRGSSCNGIWQRTRQTNFGGTRRRRPIIMNFRVTSSALRHRERVFRVFVELNNVVVQFN